jgi:hypothetical protein
MKRPILNFRFLWLDGYRLMALPAAEAAAAQRGGRISLQCGLAA